MDIVSIEQACPRTISKVRTMLLSKEVPSPGQLRREVGSNRPLGILPLIYELHRG